jgi:anti-sigma B factor antagonist
LSSVALRRLPADVSKLQIEERQVDDVTVLMLTGEMLLDDGDLAFRRQINALVESSRLKILVDLAGVTHIDSSGVGMMVAQLKTVQRRGGDIRLLRLNSRGQRLFGLLKLRSTFETFDSEALAVRSFARRPGAI